MMALTLGREREDITKLTWMFVGQQSDNTRSKEAWNASISSRDTDVGSGRRRQADNEALAMTSWWEAIAGCWMSPHGMSKEKLIYSGGSLEG